MAKKIQGMSKIMAAKNSKKLPLSGKVPMPGKMVSGMNMSKGTCPTCGGTGKC